MDACSQRVLSLSNCQPAVQPISPAGTLLARSSPTTPPLRPGWDSPYNQVLAAPPIFLESHLLCSGTRMHLLLLLANWLLLLDRSCFLSSLLAIPLALALTKKECLPCRACLHLLQLELLRSCSYPVKPVRRSDRAFDIALMHFPYPVAVCSQL
jgi:hypothetical protein